MPMLKLIEELKATSARLESVVQAQLLKEDAARLERIKELAETSEDFSIRQEQIAASCHRALYQLVIVT